MDFNFSEEQEMLRNTVAAYLADKYDFATRRSVIAATPGWRPTVWKDFAENLGILGVSLPETLGGLGGGAIENMIIMEELGKYLVVEPFISTVVIGGGFLKHSDNAQAAALASGVIKGEVRFAFAHAEPNGSYNLSTPTTAATKDGNGWRLNGKKSVVVDAPFATHFIVSARTSLRTNDYSGISVFLVRKELAGITQRAFPTIDGGRASALEFSNVRLESTDLLGTADDGLPLIEKVADEAIAALCGEACGVLRKLLDNTVEYTKQRKQFGVAISSFQALQHRMVDMFMHLEQSVSMTYVANIKVEDDTQRPLAVSAAKIQIGKACKFLGQSAIQLHGGMGMTDDMPAGHFFKRATMLERAFGSTDHHLARYEALSVARVAS